ncbi:UTP--glucose-1-phosphate uridylyltransferase [Rhodobacteraceae bacterium WD3A24]|nr:UTP--glucose-1-phosphate uridylyltransferase [Rhodobacteraceae bacterium WD3A24]
MPNRRTPSLRHALPRWGASGRSDPIAIRRNSRSASLEEDDLKITKAVFPVAGLGTRFLPATKAMPKELLPIIDKPIIQFAVEEAVAAGITELIFVTGRTKRAIEDHFDTNPELEHALEAKGKGELLDMVRSILPKGVNCVFVRQAQARGLGDAVLCAAPVVGDAPFAVLLADDFMRGVTLPTSALVASYDRAPGTLLSVMEVAPEEVSKYGIVTPGPTGIDEELGVAGLMEKPTMDDAPSRLASVGRYVFEPGIFDLLRGLGPGAGGEVQLADAIDILAGKGGVRALPITGRRYDCGSKFGYLEAILDVGLEDEQFRPRFMKMMQERCAPHCD